jgi:hypothetical protein
VILILDSLMWMFDGQPGSAVSLTYPIVTGCYYILNPLICVLWNYYVDYYIHKSQSHLRKFAIPLMLPALINVILVIMNPFNNILFYIDENNVFHRGPYFPVLAIISFLLCVYSTVYVLFSRKRLPSRNSEPAHLPASSGLGAVFQTLH